MANFLTNRSGHRVNQVTLQEVERRELQAILLRNPSLRQARDLLQARLFQNGVTLATPEEENTVVTPAFAEILDQHYLPFARSLLDDYIAFGYSHFYLQTLIIGHGKKRRKVTVPRQLPFGAYEVRLEVEPFRPVRLHFDCTLNANQVEDLFSIIGHGPAAKRSRKGRKERVVGVNKSKSTTTEAGKPRYPTIYPIIFDQSILPDINTAKHNSLIASLIRSFRYTDVMNRFNLQAEYLRANPKLITRPKETKNDAKASKDLDPDSIVDSELLRIREKQRNNLKLQSMETMVECQDHGKARITLKIDDDYIQLHDQTENIFHLPYDVELASSSVQQAASRQDLLDFQLNNSRQTLQVLGIPSSLVAGKDVSLKNSGAGKLNENDMKMFFKSLQGYKKVIQAGLQEPYDLIYRTETKQGTAKVSTIKPVETVQPEDGDDNASQGDKKASSSVEQHQTVISRELIEIPLVNDTLSVDTILLLAENGAIDEEEKKKYLLIYAGLSDLI